MGDNKTKGGRQENRKATEAAGAQTKHAKTVDDEEAKGHANDGKNKTNLANNRPARGGDGHTSQPHQQPASKRRSQAQERDRRQQDQERKAGEQKGDGGSRGTDQARQDRRRRGGQRPHQRRQEQDQPRQQQASKSRSQAHEQGCRWREQGRREKKEATEAARGSEERRGARPNVTDRGLLVH